MASKSYLIHTFLSATSEMEKECNIVKKVANTLNENWSRFLNIRYEIYYYKDFRPGFSIDGQQFVNNQLPDLLDLYLGIMGNKVGTPTARAESGTIEEFNGAYAQYKNDNNSIEIMMYFKEQRNTKVKETLVEQGLVKNFKTRVSKLGSFYKSYKSTSSFESMMTSHLSIYLQNKFQSLGFKIQDTSSIQSQEVLFIKHFRNSRESFNSLSEQLKLLYIKWDEFMDDHMKLLENKNPVTIKNFNFKMFRYGVKTSGIVSLISSHRIKMFSELSKFLSWLFVASNETIDGTIQYVDAMKLFNEKLAPLIQTLTNNRKFADMFFKQGLIKIKTKKEIEKSFTQTINEFEELLRMFDCHIKLIQNSNVYPK